MLKRFFQDKLTEAGCDEAGRGCLAGPVFAAAVMLPAKFSHPLLNDSKQVTEKNRNELRLIIEKEALAFSVASVSSGEIDEINILKASFKAMHLAIDGLKKRPGLLLIDGNRFIPYPGISHRRIIKGDATYMSIAAASILAKTYRDEYMLQLHDQFPQYGWDKNKGYGTITHRHSIVKYGVSEYHRKSFRLLPLQGSLFER